MRQSFGFKFIKGGVAHPKVVAHAVSIDNLLSMVVQWVSGSSDPQLVRYSLKEVMQANGPSTRAGTPGSIQGGVGQQRVQALPSYAAVSRKMMAGVAAGTGSVMGSIVEGEAGADDWHHVLSSSVTYTVDQMCGYPADSEGWLDPGFIHTAVIAAEDLTPNQRFYYQYGSEVVGWSAVQSALTPPPKGSPEPFKFLVFNDVAMTSPILFNNKCPPYCPEGLHFSGKYGENSSKLVPLLEAETEAQLAILVGDLAYAVGYGADWDQFGHQFEKAFTTFPLMVGTGNHERDYPGTGDAFADQASDSGGECNVPFAYRYYMPTANSTGQSHTSGATKGEDGDRRHRSVVKKLGKLPGRPHQDPSVSYYSFDMGSVHFVILDTETPSPADTAQGRFVAQDLSSVNRSTTPWVIVGMHRMMLAPGTWAKPNVGDMDNMERLQNDYEDLFMRHGVDLVVQGHEHAYARSCMFYQGNCVDDSTRNNRTANKSVAEGAPDRAPVYILAARSITIGHQERNGYLRFTASATELFMEAVSSDDGSLMDHLKIKARQQ
eukprot:gene27165-2406_t